MHVASEAAMCTMFAMYVILTLTNRDPSQCAGPLGSGGEQTGQLREGDVNVTSSGTQGSSFTEGSRGITAEVGDTALPSVAQHWQSRWRPGDCSHSAQILQSYMYTSWAQINAALNTRKPSSQQFRSIVSRIVPLRLHACLRMPSSAPRLCPYDGLVQLASTTLWFEYYPKNPSRIELLLRSAL